MSYEEAKEVGSPSTIRSNRRIPIVVEVSSLGEMKGKWITVNISETGMFLQGAPVFPPETPLHLAWALNDGDAVRPMAANATVVWANDPARPDSNPRLPAGMGVRFEDMSNENQKLLSQALHGDDASPVSTADNPLEGEDLSSGTILGSYRIIRTLGRGGTATVYEAEHLSLGRRVALKRMHPNVTSDSDAVRRFFHEGRIVNRVAHENIVEVTDFVSEAKEKYYVMELLEGISLAHLRETDAPLPVDRVLRIGIQLCDALEAVHRAGIVHRDLKPANILIVKRRNEPDYVKLLDFGIARDDDTQSNALLSTQAGMLVGTPGYLAPEYGQGAKPNPRSDLYSLGVILYELVTGSLLFEPGPGESWMNVLAMHVLMEPVPPTKAIRELGLHWYSIPDELEALIMSCLAKDPNQRPQSASEIGQRLRELEAGTNGHSTLSQSHFERKNRRTLLFGVAGLLILVVAIIVIFVLRDADSESVAASSEQTEAQPNGRNAVESADKANVTPTKRGIKKKRRRSRRPRNNQR